MSGNVTWISFAYNPLVWVKNNEPSARLGFVVWEPTEYHIDLLVGMKTAENDVFLDAHYSYVNSELVAYAAEKNIPIECWSVTTENQVTAADPYISGFTCDTIHAGRLLFDTYLSK